MTTRVPELFGIRYPIIQGVTGGKHMELAAAVSNAGGLGVLHGGTVARDACQTRTMNDPIREMRRLTDRPFSINIPVSLLARNLVEQLVGVIIAEGMKVVTTSAGDPRLYTPRFKAANLKVIHVVATVGQALKAADAGVDVVVASGFEAGGWQSREEVTTLALVPQVVDALKGRTPVIAAGGIGDARGMLAAFALGAEGVQLGTRFLASVEAGLEEGYRQSILQADDDSTEIVGRGQRPARNFRLDYLARVRPGYTRPPIGPAGAAGQVAGLMKEVLPISEIVRRMTEGLAAEYVRLSEQLAQFLPARKG